jgi:hypothetical protein
MWWLRHAAELRAAGIALLALALVWPDTTAGRVPLAIAGGFALTASAWGASFDGRSLMWAAVAAVVVAVAMWWSAPPAHASLAKWGCAWWVLLGSAAAVYGCVPETDQMREVAVIIAAGGVAEVLTRRRLPTPALLAAMGVVEWSALYGASGQGRALVGGLFALTPLIAVALVASRNSPARAVWLPYAIAGVWVVAAVVVARTGGIATSLAPALWSAAAGGGAAIVLSAVLVRRAHR